MAKHILVVDDDALLRRSLVLSLEQAGYRAAAAASAEDALEAARLAPPDLVLLDIGLPGMDGLEALRSFKQQFAVPVIFLTARRRSLDQVVGLEMGADDYITKPFDMDVLLARVKNALRHAAAAPPPAPPLIRLGDLEIDPAARTAMLSGQPLDLTRREFDLLHLLASHPNQVVTFDQILSQVWGAEYVGQPQVVYVNIRWLRQKVEDDPSHPQRILLLHGVGYRLQVQEG
jgi:DNA-binding response OmpR family regulator